MRICKHGAVGEGLGIIEEVVASDPIVVEGSILERWFKMEAPLRSWPIQ